MLRKSPAQPIPPLEPPACKEPRDGRAHQADRGQAQEPVPKGERQRPQHQRAELPINVRLIRTSHITQPAQGHHVVAEIQVQKNRNRVHAPRRPHLGIQRRIRDNMLQIKRTAHEHDRERREGNRQIKIPAGPQYGRKQRIVWRCTFRGRLDATGPQLLHTTPRVRKGPGQLRRKAEVKQRHDGTDTDKQLPDAEPVGR